MQMLKEPAFEQGWCKPVQFLLDNRNGFMMNQPYKNAGVSAQHPQDTVSKLIIFPVWDLLSSVGDIVMYSR